MTFDWLKRYVPRSLYGRAALILVLPVVTLQLVVSVVFIQRHFEGVTRQMTGSLSLELGMLLEADKEEAALLPEITLDEISNMLEIAVTKVPEADLPAEDQRRWYDFSGLVVISTLDENVPQVRAVLLPDNQRVTVFAEGSRGLLRFDFSRKRVSASNPHQLLVNMVVFGILMTAISFIYLRNQLRPVTRLAKAAEAFGRGRVEPYRPSGAVEVRAAGNAFLDMRTRIERQIEQRTLMLSGVSHDLRTPLTRLKLGLSMLEDEDREPMERDVAEMQRLLDEFLAFARGTTGEEVEEVDPIALVRQIVEDDQRGKVPVTLVATEGEGTVQLRPGAIRRAVENLISNAVRYGERAEVSVTLSEKSLRIRVEDDGPGIPAERREEALRPFTRLDESRNQNRGLGVGLGLSIAIDIARAHGGVLRLGDSTRMGGLQADIVIAR
ncbi:ATP-binding protein [Pseudooceanicola sp. 502str34]|uniref:ATP-binding protein n=1 Tax=Maritimibacter alkaliphilus TaxID=404236 RepID=UPI001C98D503|nr:ATP-binding protein [Maritimibacter alkaliphilus]MBY6089329.1 ATP-binding protein [Maritimibacter alkaliphilus]